MRRPTEVHKQTRRCSFYEIDGVKVSTNVDKITRCVTLLNTYIQNKKPKLSMYIIYLTDGHIQNRSIQIKYYSKTPSKK